MSSLYIKPQTTVKTFQTDREVIHTFDPPVVLRQGGSALMIGNVDPPCVIVIHYREPQS
jgi:hypothetical protein